MYDTQVFPIVNNGQLGDAVMAHLMQGIHHQSILIDGLGLGSHDLGGFHVFDVGVFH